MSFETVCSADGKMFACIGRRVNVFEVKSRQRILSAHPFSHPSHAGFSPDNKKLAVKFTSGRILVLSTATGDVLRDYKNQREGEGSELFFSPDGKKLVDGSWKGVISIRELIGSRVATKEFPGEMIDRVSQDSRKLLWLFQHRRKVQPGQNWPDYDYLALHSWPLFQSEPRIFSFYHYLESATVSPDGSRICFIGRQRGIGHWLQIVQISNGKTIAKSEDITTGGTGSDLTWSADSSLVGSIQGKRFVLYRAADLAVVAELPAEYPSSICFLPRNDLVVLGTWNSSTLHTLSELVAKMVGIKTTDKDHRDSRRR